jgi:SAM-dependent methyltransferase
LRALDKIFRSYLQKRGYAVSKLPVRSFDDGYSLVSYSSHDEYVSIQIDGNKKKIDKVFADEETIGIICDYLRPRSPKRGLCHGSRNGTEVRWFREKLGIEVIGSDISDTAPDHGLIQWDFHERNPDWVGRFDFVYTNSHDHAYDPKKAISAWVEQLAPGGVLLLEHTLQHGPQGQTKLDPLAIDLPVVPFAILNMSDGEYAVTDIIKPAHNKGGGRFYVYVVTRTLST